MENRAVSKEVIKISKTNYAAKENLAMVINKAQVKKNILDKKFQLIDARSKERFSGLTPEPRQGL